ncbi:protein of unknown function [Nitrospira japonica]|uniref:Uncharacterized protein n=1 Tax=Nitrospira japonica TaxID=1325564 RepID=A0A1W1I6L4_9BACT|nr:protein of unknown function [Nitrospira japonica]
MRRRLEQRREAHRLPSLQRLKNRVHPVANREVVGDDFHERLAGIPIEYSLQRVHQIEQAHVVQRLFSRGPFFFLRRRSPGIDFPPHALLRVQLAGGILVALVFEQPPHEFLARIRPVILVLHGFVDRQQHLRLDLEQRGGHDQKLPRNGEIQLGHRFEVVEVLAGDQRDGNVIDIDLALLDEMQQKIERPLEILDANLVWELGLTGSFELVIHKPPYTSFGRLEQASAY